MPLPRGYHLEHQSGSYRKVHEADAPCAWCPARTPAVVADPALPVPGADGDAHRYVRTLAAPAQQAEADVIVRQVAADLHLPQVPAVAWFRDAAAGETPLFTSSEPLRGAAAADQCAAIWVAADVGAGLMETIGHEVKHLADDRRGARLTRTEREAAATRYGLDFVRRIADGERPGLPRRASPPAVRPGGSALAAALRGR